MPGSAIFLASAKQEVFDNFLLMPVDELLFLLCGRKDSKVQFCWQVVPVCPAQNRSMGFVPESPLFCETDLVCFSCLSSPS